MVSKSTADCCIVPHISLYNRMLQVNETPKGDAKHKNLKLEEGSIALKKCQETKERDHRVFALSRFRALIVPYDVMHFIALYIFLMARAI